ncbi:MAG TPA: tetratricopeptide repeat protein [Gammaproteobacteria bacterium]|jgi:predicted TPR repeat methyltransferase|nr:tetratricopeptide repeat protein [Gammaproteobacteria bacterium]
MNKTLDDFKLLHHSGNLAEARFGYLSLLEKNPDDLEVLHLMGLLSAEEGKLDEACKYLEKALIIAPQHTVIRLHFANILKAAGRLDDAVNELQKIIAEDPVCAPAYNNLGAIYFTRKDYDNAIQAYHAALDIRPDYIDAYYNLGLAAAKAGRDDEAFTAYHALIQIETNHGGAHYQLGCLLMKRGRFKDAVDEFSIVIKSHPNHFESLANLAACYLRLGQADKSAAVYLQALDISPEDRDVLFNLGVIHMQQGYAREAVKYYARAVKSHPDFYDAHHNLATYYLMARDRENALVHFHEAVRIKPNDDSSKHLIRILMHDKELKSSAPAYIQSLFDSYADYYDAHMRTHLHYQVPEKLFEAVETAGVLSHGKVDIVDIGCGTGLSGELFKPYAKKMIGVDLSDKMLEAAAQKNIYDELVSANIVNWLNDQKEKCDLVLAGDVLVYFGELEELIAGVKNILRPQGYFAFNVEINKNNDYALMQSGRFSHHQDYLARLAQENKFEIVSADIFELRREAGGQVMGYLSLWKKVA